MNTVKKSFKESALCVVLVALCIFLVLTIFWLKVSGYIGTPQSQTQTPSKPISNVSEKIVSKPSDSRIQTPLPIVYQNEDGTEEASDVLYLGRKVIGILSADYCIALRYEGLFNYADALEKEESLKKPDADKWWFIPGYFDGLAFAKQRDAFDATVDILNANGISAEKWKTDNWHWSRNSRQGDFAYVFSMYTGDISMRFKTEELYVRLARVMR